MSRKRGILYLRGMKRNIVCIEIRIGFFTHQSLSMKRNIVCIEMSVSAAEITPDSIMKRNIVCIEILLHLYVV